ncbi:MAG: hypothetical protein LQ344_001923 [Seirophora lacunosa]|nr:MAG: hypothetical protein LQ344_001923 [Seirophora lacunosa]
MDIATSIHFNTQPLDNHNRPPVPGKGHGIDVSRQFDLYTNYPLPDPVEAPPVYQKDQSPPASVPSMTQTPQPHQPSESPNPPKFILKTIPHIPTPPRSAGEDRARQTQEVRQSLQLPRPTFAQSTETFLKPIKPIDESHSTPKHPGEDAVVCELAGTSMDFTQPDEAMPGRMGMANGASACTIQITSRKKNLPGGQSRTVRSIWVIAHDGKVCIQHKLPKETNVIPYTIWGNQTKVVIRRPTELRFYKTSKSASSHKTVKTSWVTYNFQSVSTAAEFQSALIPPLVLIRTLSTSRVVRMHNSPWVRTFSPRMQLCGLENMRIFKDLSEPNCLVCMIHYSPNFRPLNGEEYVVFRLYPPPRNSVRIREDGEQCVKIKGLDIRGSSAVEEKKKKAKAPQSQAEQLEEEAYGSYSIEKIKIEFDSGKEKQEFLELTRELQGLSSW